MWAISAKWEKSPNQGKIVHPCCRKALANLVLSWSPLERVPHPSSSIWSPSAQLWCCQRNTLIYVEWNLLPLFLVTLIGGRGCKITSYLKRLWDHQHNYQHSPYNFLDVIQSLLTGSGQPIWHDSELPELIAWTWTEGSLLNWLFSIGNCQYALLRSSLENTFFPASRCWGPSGCGTE